jgi:hypothetical protein
MTDDITAAGGATHRTDFGAPILAGPFDSLEAARDAQRATDGGVGVYYELADDKWYVHGSTGGTDDAPPLTTYN